VKRRGGRLRHASPGAVLLPFALVVAGAYAPAQSQSAASIAGVYLCKSGCRVTDAAPSVELDGDDAACTNELGGMYRGKLLSDGSLSCFNKIGKLSEDRQTIRWSNGMIWRRVETPARR
jgi:hypothetical protein